MSSLLERRKVRLAQRWMRPLLSTFLAARVNPNEAEREHMAVEPSSSPATFHRWQKWWRWAVGIGLLITLIGIVGPTSLIDAFRRVSVEWFLIITMLALLWLCLGALNVWFLLRRLEPVRLHVFLGVYVVSWATSLLLPGQLGDVSQVFLLRRHGVSIRSSGAAYVVDKILSLGWLGLVASYGIGRYLLFIQGWRLVIPPVLGGIGGIVGMLIVKYLSTSSTGAVPYLAGLLTQMQRFQFYPGAVMLNIIITVLKWLLMGGFYWVAFLAFDVSLPFEAVAVIPVMSSLVGYIPVTVGGAGTMEWTAVALFGQVGVADVAVLSVHLFLRGALLFAALLILLISRLGNFNSMER